MRILFCTDTYPPQLNGVSVVTAAMVAGLHHRGWECAVIAPTYPPGTRDVLPVPVEVAQHGIPAVSWPPYPDVRLALRARSRVRDIIREFAPTVVHCASELAIGRAGLLEARAHGIPVCTTYHTDFSRYCDAYGVPWLRPAVTRWIARFHQRANLTLTPSRAARRSLHDLDVRHVRVWSGGIDAEQFHPRHFSLLTRHRLAMGQAFTFLYVGRLAPEKSVDVVLSAFARLSAQCPAGSVRLLVAGAGPSEATLRNQAPPGVTFLGAVNRASDLPALYASADAFVYASTTETLGLVILEAMASGLPVVATPALGVGDYLEDGRNGLAFPAHNVDACAQAMSQLCTGDSLHERLRLGARQTAERFADGAEMDRLDAMLQDLAQAPPHAAPAHRLFSAARAVPDSR
jgi:phosphatidylinositol alpha 1,6-mannosyltransferase